MLPLFLQSLGIGFMVALPLGPIGLLCIERTLARGLSTGLATGLGVALADGSYGLLVALGFASLAQVLQAQSAVISVIGGLGLTLLGARGWRRAQQARQAARAGADTGGGAADTGDGRGSGDGGSGSGGGSGGATARSLLAALVSVYLLTLANPTTILSFLAIFAALGIGGADLPADAPAAAGQAATRAVMEWRGFGGSLREGIWAVAGILLGSLLWWIVLTGFVAWLRHKLAPAVVTGLNGVANALLVVLGLFLAGRGLW